VRTDMVRAFVESLLERLTGSEKVVPDADEDYPVRFRGALYYVRLVGDVDPVVQVFSVALSGVPASARLLRDLNQLNTDVRFVRVFWVRDQVLVETELVGASIDPEGFANACRAVATVTDHIGPMLAQRFGGTTAFADEKSGEAPAADRALTGLYL
jgi:hypothetical protein